MKSILQWAEGEVLSLGLPLPGTVALLVRSETPGGTFVFGTRVMARGQTLATHRFLSCDVVYVIQKGQGRATVEGQSLTVVSGMTISAPRGHWHALQNTGTGELHVAWLAVPAGIEGFFRELGQPRADPSALQELSARYGVEFQTAPERPAVSLEHGGPRKRRRGGRGRRRAGVSAAVPSPAPPFAPPPSAPTLVPSPVPPAETSVSAPQAASASPVGPRRHRRHRRPRRRPQGSAAPTPVSSAPSGASTPPPAASAPSKPPAAPRSQSRGTSGHRRSKVKEVYMGGRWVRVTGEGPVIAQ